MRALIVEGKSDMLTKMEKAESRFWVLLRYSLLLWCLIERRFRQRHSYESPFLDGRLNDLAHYLLYLSFR